MAQVEANQMTPIAAVTAPVTSPSIITIWRGQPEHNRLDHAAYAIVRAVHAAKGDANLAEQLVLKKLARSFTPHKKLKFERLAKALYALTVLSPVNWSVLSDTGLYDQPIIRQYATIALEQLRSESGVAEFEMLCVPTPPPRERKPYVRAEAS